MGNQGSSPQEGGGRGGGGLKSRLTSIRRPKRDVDDEYSSEDIRQKFQRMPRLTQEEIKIIRSSWKLIHKKIEQCGAETFLRLFEQHPDTKAVFRQFQGIDLLALEQSLEIKDHGERVMKIIDKVVHCIDNPNKVWDLLLGYGKIHYGYGALPMYFDLMGPHFVIAVRSCCSEDWYEALEYHWLAVFNMIVFVMKFGWNLQRAEEQKRARHLLNKRSGKDGKNAAASASAAAGDSSSNSVGKEANGNGSGPSKAT